ncbi:MAG TPA: anaerobic glycerol-3-phosphate dehydrogenase subunit GlpB [Symbiobacteriaceae bacterium]|nr:anaerobic glycerol-3-phosphate dehydrogenase subunit GlpB [Symbiobacteriaceae bacterium]
MKTEVLVIGGGMAGSLAALTAARAGRQVCLVAAGEAALHMESGCIDLWGKGYPDPPSTAIRALDARHPYSLAGYEALCAGVAALCQYTEEAGYPYYGSLDQVRIMPTAYGTLRPTGLVPPTMAGAAVTGLQSLLVAGISELKDSFPDLVAENLSASLGIPVRATTLAASGGEAAEMTPVQVASLLNDPKSRSAFWQKVARLYQGEAAVALPPVLGTLPSTAVLAEGQETLGCPVFELSATFPSVPGMRLARLLTRALRAARVRVVMAEAMAGIQTGDRVAGVRLRSPGGESEIHCRAVILATGGLTGGAFDLNEEGNQLRERIFGLPVQGAGDRNAWTRPDWLDEAGQPITRAGVAANQRLQPVSESGQPLLANLFLAGRILAGQDPELEKCGNGVAIATGYKAGLLAAGVN